MLYVCRETGDRTLEARALLTGGEVGQACSVLQAAGDHRYRYHHHQHTCLHLVILRGGQVGGGG